jgi:hypothetical protein
LKYSTYNHRQAEEILNSKKETFDEIKTIISGLSLTPSEKGDHKKIKEAFKSKGWNCEEPISNRVVTFTPTGGILKGWESLEKGWRYDAFKNRIAVEIDTKAPSYRSFLKFILGYNEGKIDVGVILCYDDRYIPKAQIKNLPRFTVREKELKDLFSIVPVPILLVGIY